jgi:hypothetical protein
MGRRGDDRSLHRIAAVGVRICSGVGPQHSASPARQALGHLRCTPCVRISCTVSQ